MVTQEQLNDAILSLTGKPEWDILSKFLVSEAMAARDSCADANTWEDVLRKRGFSDGLAFVVNLREMTESYIEQTHAVV